MLCERLRLTRALTFLSLPLSIATAAGAQDAAPPAAEPAPAEEAAPSVNLSLFADTYVSYNSSKSGTAGPYHRAFDNLTPFDPVTGFPVLAGATPDADPIPLGYGMRNGFGLSMVGLDASFDTGTVGATAFLRFGPTVPIYYAQDMGVAGLDSLLGGFVTIKPTAELTLDAGYFGTIYGAEVAESWINFNYTRGALYYAMQPFYHFGVKGAYAINDMVTVRAMVVNGVNNIADENDAPGLGLQLALAGIGDVFDLTVGAFYETGDDSSWGIETFFDTIATLHLGDLTVLANFDYNIDRGADGADDTSNYGVAGTVAYAATPEVGVAVRGEYLADPDDAIFGAPGDGDMNLITATGTLDLRLLPHLILRPEFRYETSSRDIFTDGDGAATDSWFTAVLGVVATTQ